MREKLKEVIFGRHIDEALRETLREVVREELKKVGFMLLRYHVGALPRMFYKEKLTHQNGVLSLPLIHSFDAGVIIPGVPRFFLRLEKGSFSPDRLFAPTVAPPFSGQV